VNDRVLLCSDGLSNMLRDEDMVAILEREPDAQRAAQQLVNAANAAGGEDNITAVVIDVVDEPASSPGAAVTSVEAEVVDVDAEAPTSVTAAVPTTTRPPRRRGRRVLRVLAWTLPVLLIIGIGVGALGWYARRNYYVGVDDGRVAIFKGIPGGILGWDPTVERHTRMEPDELTRAQQADVEEDKQFSSLEGAEAYVTTLRRGVVERSTPSTTTTTVPPTTTTTVPPPPPPPEPAPPPAS
jgi:protein phosphatase